MSVGIETLRKSGLFDACDDALLEQVRAQGKERTYAAGDLVYAEMAQSDELYLVLEGRLRHTSALLDAAGVDYDMPVEPGEVSNVVRFLAEGPSYISCVADTDTKVLVWKAQEAAEFWDQHPEIGYRVVTAIAKRLHQRLQQMNQIILDRMSWGLE
jgi:CRP-like cAMP-binding protein